jgi:hypothetical protein
MHMIRLETIFVYELVEVLYLGYRAKKPPLWKA